jgi:hypothetical protein
MTGNISCINQLYTNFNINGFSDTSGRNGLQNALFATLFRQISDNAIKYLDILLMSISIIIFPKYISIANFPHKTSSNSGITKRHQLKQRNILH